MKVVEAYGTKRPLVGSLDKLESSIDGVSTYYGPALIEVKISLIKPVNPMVSSGKSNHEMEGY